MNKTFQSGPFKVEVKSLKDEGHDTSKVTLSATQNLAYSAIATEEWLERETGLESLLDQMSDVLKTGIVNTYGLVPVAARQLYTTGLRQEVMRHLAAAQGSNNPLIQALAHDVETLMSDLRKGY